MKKQNLLLLLCMQLCFMLTLQAQQHTYTGVHYDDHSGMSQWHVTKMLQDKRGFMWFSTWNGLNRYDGYDFAVFKSKPGDGNNLTSDRIRNMVLGDDGHIYCVNNSKVWRFNLQTYKFEQVDSVLQERYLARMNYDTSVFKQPQDMQFGDLHYEGIRQYMQDAQKNHWLMERFGVSKVSPVLHPATFLDCVPRSTVRAMYRDRSKRIWIGTRDTNIIAVLDSTANLIGYLGLDGRLHKEQVTFAPIYCFYQQKDGTLWIGTKPEGMFRLTEQGENSFSITHYLQGTEAQIKAGKALSSESVYSFMEDKQGRLWIATQGSGLNLLENPKAPVEQARFRNCTNTFTKYPRGNVFMRRLTNVGDSLMFATTTEGLLVVKGVNGDASKIDITLHQRESTRRQSLSCSAVMDIVVDRKGRVFISSESGGVNLLLTPDLNAKQFDFEHFDTDNGMGSDAALAMVEVGDEIMVQCNNQVTRINADLHTIENFNDMFFSVASRFSDAEPILLRDGRWLLSLEDGVLLMPEQMFHQRSYVPRIAFTSFDLPGFPTDYSADLRDTLRLSDGIRDVTINYAALDYSDNSNLKYITRITEGSHWWNRNDSTEWSVPQEDHSLSLYNLAPGTYTLEVRSTNAEGLWVDNTRTLTIIVEPMFWETWWAYLLYTLLFIGVIAGITYTYTHVKQLERQREENLQAYLTLLNAQAEAKAQAETQAAEVQTAAGTGDGHSANSDAGTTASQPAAPQMMIASPIINEEDDAFMRRLLNFVDENLGNSDVGVDEMASATATSRSSLNRKMKQLLGVTPADFLKEARMKRAQQLLASTMRGVNEIAYGCGFSDPKYFSKCFKSTVGMSPSEYRTMAQAAVNAVHQDEPADNPA